MDAVHFASVRRPNDVGVIQPADGFHFSMKPGHVIFDPKFIKQMDSLPLDVEDKLKKMLLLLRENALHPSLRLHKLSGKWEGFYSLSLDRKYRVIFEVMENQDLLFVSVGTHAIYD